MKIPLRIATAVRRGQVLARCHPGLQGVAAVVVPGHGRQILAQGHLGSALIAEEGFVLGQRFHQGGALTHQVAVGVEGGGPRLGRVAGALEAPGAHQGAVVIGGQAGSGERLGRTSGPVHHLQGRAGGAVRAPMPGLDHKGLVALRRVGQVVEPLHHEAAVAGGVTVPQRGAGGVIGRELLAPAIAGVRGPGQGYVAVTVHVHIGSAKLLVGARHLDGRRQGVPAVDAREPKARPPRRGRRKPVRRGRPPPPWRGARAQKRRVAW